MLISEQNVSGRRRKKLNSGEWMSGEKEHMLLSIVYSYYLFFKSVCHFKIKN